MPSFVDLPGIALGVTPLQEARASAALPAQGGWDTPTELFISEAEWLTIIFTYTRGAAGGAFDWQMETTPYAVAGLVPAGAQEWSDPTAYAVGGVVAGADTQNLVQEEYATYTSTQAAADTHTVGPIAMGGAAERLRIRCRESGVVGTPGTLQIEILVR